MCVAATVQQQGLGRTGVEVSRIGLGCATFGREIDRPAPFELMDHAVRCGINLFDTAEAYGGGQARDYRRTQLQIDDRREVSGEYHSSEKIIGRWLRSTSLRKAIFLVSKVTTDFSKQHVREALHASLEHLKTDYLDLYLFHSFDRGTPIKVALEAMDEVKREGLVRFTGCSNFSSDQLRSAFEASEAGAFAGPDAVEALCNLAMRDAEQDLLPFCAQKELGFLAYSPLGAGFLTGKYSGNRSELPPGSRFHIIPAHADLYFNERSFAALGALSELSERTGVPAVQLAIAWVLAHRGVTSVLCGARVRAHIENAIAAATLAFPASWSWPATMQPVT